MTSSSGDKLDELAGGIRIAVEGCGHGTLDAIYSSILKACAVKGWDGVDLVIIGGDFQAVRDRYDLKVTAMPAKYRTMADFHQYYWGKKTAPFLTIFVGGNHEASNHLFELYYGGWVAPNIYYLGAANVIQVGPLRIAGMSGIWKGYDYRKPHYERLPYSHDDMYSIYHVRELDVRKLLSFRSQVDIGISHDWPKGIEWLGDHKGLFKHKAHLREDAESGRLGSTAAQKVMDHLRPPYWFSAHLHTKYAALKSHASGFEEQQNAGSSKTRGVAAHRSNNIALRSATYQEQVSAWNNFGTRVRQEEAADTAKLIQEEDSRREEAERAGLPLSANFIINETYKKIKVEKGIQRTVAVSYDQQQDDDPRENLSSLQLDGCVASLPLKRRREHNESFVDQQSPFIQDTVLRNAHANGSELSPLIETVAANPDAIDIDMSDDEEAPLIADMDARKEIDLGSTLSSYSKTSGQESVKAESAKAQLDHNHLQNQDQLTNPDIEQDDTAPANATYPSNMLLNTDSGRRMTDENMASAEGSVSEEMRAQLAALSSKFEEPVHISPPLPHPENITNVMTRFLALSKSEDRQNFLQLLEMHPYGQNSEPSNRPFTLSYVPEWLAILRTFASELSLGGSPKDTVPQHRGDTFYRDKILENEAWIQENVTGPGLVEIPQDFVTTVAYHDPAEAIDARDMPREVTNPQTTAFCKLIGIENIFDISEEERDTRMAAGPSERPGTDVSQRGTSQRGRGGHGGRSSRGGRGGRGWNARGRGGRRS